MMSNSLVEREPQLEEQIQSFQQKVIFVTVAIEGDQFITGFLNQIFVSEHAVNINLKAEISTVIDFYNVFISFGDMITTFYQLESNGVTLKTDIQKKVISCKISEIDYEHNMCVLSLEISLND